jgi:predicted transcriptional regulator
MGSDENGDMPLTPVQRAILVDLLVHGDNKAENIGNRTGFHRNSVSRSMKPLVDDNHISHKGGGVYQLKDSGRNTARSLLRGGYNPYSDEN